MRTLTKATVAVGTVFAGWIAWGVYASRSAESIPYAHLRTRHGIEFRRYPRTVRVETSAPDQRTAFRRLYRYISGANERRESVSMTTPVETRRADSLSMTVPVQTASSDRSQEASQSGTAGTDAAVRMSFYLPPAHDRETTPEPTDPAVSLTVDPARTVAVTRFSWYAPAWRVASLERTLLRTVERDGIDPVGDPYLLRYDDPWTPPFMRRNEVAVAVDLDA